MIATRILARAIDEQPVVLELSGLSRRLGRSLVLDRIDLTLRRGELVALLGENGAGKSTLAGILSGRQRADRGTIEVTDGAGGLRRLKPATPAAALDAGIGMVPQHCALADTLTGFENIILGTEPLLRLRHHRERARVDLRRIMAEGALHAPLDEPVGGLPLIHRQRVKVLKALYRRAAVLVLDEPTAALSPHEAAEMLETLRRLAAQGIAVLYLTPRPDEAAVIGERIVVLRGGRIVANRTARAFARDELAGLMSGRTAQTPSRPPIPEGDEVLALDRVVVADPAGGNGLDDVSLTLRSGEILGIAGAGGNGQAALAALLSGLAAPRSGEVRLFGRPVRTFSPAGMLARGVGRLTGDRRRIGTAGELSLWENAVLEHTDHPAVSRSGWIRRRAARAFGGELIRAFEIEGTRPDTYVSALSGENVQKLILGRILAAGSGLILADHPTRGLDLRAAEYVRSRLLAVRAAGGAVVLISDDLDELFALSDRMAVLHVGMATPPMPAAALTPATVGLLTAGIAPIAAE